MLASTSRPESHTIVIDLLMLVQSGHSTYSPHIRSANAFTDSNRTETLDPLDTVRVSPMDRYTDLLTRV